MERNDTRLDILMAEKGIRTDKELAEALGFSQQQLSFRLKKISIDTLETLAGFFGTSVKDLLK